MKGIKIRITGEELLMTISIIAWVSFVSGMFLLLFVFSITKANTIYDRVIASYTTLQAMIIVPGLLLVGWAMKIKDKKGKGNVDRDAQVSPGDEISGTHGRSYAK